ncbi:MAG TPA: hypothetical protein VNO51_02595 [Ilumatobacteraceae bacterium]|nr:hypothetical protein [Ilumatobacteraceae bacterium]
MTRLRPLLIITGLTVTGCGSTTDSDAAGNRTSDPIVAPSAVQSVTTDADAPVAEVPEALRFRAPLVGGGEIDMSTLADRPVVLWFWAPY